MSSLLPRSMQVLRRWSGWVLFLATTFVLCRVGLQQRRKLVEEWHVPAGDGLQYFQLSQELVKHRRLAYGPAPKPLTFSRLPGYPLFLAQVAVRTKTDDIQVHLRHATRANVLLDIGTALLVLLLVRELSADRLGRHVAALLGLGFTLACPGLILLSCYGLSESLATCLATLEVYLAVRAMRGRMILLAALAGIVAGFAQLVRADALTVAPAVVLAILFADAPWRRRLVALLACGLCAAAIFAPWPIRNLRKFGEPHFGSAYWRTINGAPLPPGPIAWARTWGSSAPGESYIDYSFSWNHPVYGYMVTPAMYENEAERQLVVNIFEDYNRGALTPNSGITEAVARRFADLASVRVRADPFRVFVTLPLRRMAELWSPIPERELPMKSTLLDLPARRAWFGHIERALFALALLGAIGLALRRSPSRRRVAVLAASIGARTALFSFAVPLGVTGRYLVEVLPLLVALAACAPFAFTRSVQRPSPLGCLTEKGVPPLTES
ncbi:MAG: hypothetical protein EXR72_21205 [Myxococcales bacterium]|nr:hypothetical protein [Myxococcales bacterium]